MFLTGHIHGHIDGHIHGLKSGGNEPINGPESVNSTHGSRGKILGEGQSFVKPF